MNSKSSRAPGRSRLSVALNGPLSPERRARLIERQLKCYHARHQAAVSHVAALHPRLADLAISFPALLFALAVRRRHVDARAITLRVIGGAPLAELAAMAGLPMWLRKMPPQSFRGPIPDLPDGDLFRRQIVNHLGRIRQNHHVLLAALAIAWQWHGEGLAIWCGKVFAADSKRFELWRIRTMALWAWHSGQPGTLGHSLCERAWSMSMSYDAAATASEHWLDAVENHLAIGNDGAFDGWPPEAMVDGYVFTPITTAVEINTEAHAMNNCMRSFGGDMQIGCARFWKVARDGERVAVLQIRRSPEAPIPVIGEMKGRNNNEVALGVWLAAMKWLHAHDFTCLVTRQPPNLKAATDNAVWRSVWKPYWMAKGLFPDRLHLSCRPDWRYDLHKDDHPARRRRRRR